MYGHWSVIFAITIIKSTLDHTLQLITDCPVQYPLGPEYTFLMTSHVGNALHGHQVSIRLVWDGAENIYFIKL